VVIPVINEGARIASLLARMRALDIAARADILIVDGGSTDGSLDRGHAALGGPFARSSSRRARAS